MAQTAKLRLVDPTNDYDLAFTLHLRNANREFFFDKDLIEWKQHCEWLAGRCKDSDFSFFIIWCDNERAGTLAVEHRESCEFLQNLCVSEEFRGKGLAKWAITQLMKPNKFIVAQVKADNKHVIKMYQDLGFWKAK